MSSIGFLFAQVDQSDEIVRDQKKKEQEEIDQYWYSCNEDVRFTTLIANCGDLQYFLIICGVSIMNIVVMIAPTSEESNERWFALGYFLYGIVIFIIIGLSFKP